MANRHDVEESERTWPRKLEASGEAPSSAPRTMPTRRAGGSSSEEYAQSAEACGLLSGLSRYRDLGRIGRGGMGEVRRVHDMVLERALAMKILAWTESEQPQAHDSFLREARITSSLQHPAIVAVHDVGTLADGRPWYTMREVRGRTFGALIDELHADTVADQRRRLEELVEALVRACEGIAYAHSRGVIHRDIKPENLMVGRFGEVQVMDWGLAIDAASVPLVNGALIREIADREPLADSNDDAFVSFALARTMRGSHHSEGISGTLAYMSPEQARGALLKPTTDVYSLGAVLYQVMAARPPYQGRIQQVWVDLLSGPPTSLAELPPHPLRPVALCVIGDKAMSRDPEQRYSDAGTLAEVLRDWLQDRARHQRAQELVARADRLWPAIAERRDRANQLHEDALSSLDGVQPYDALDKKRPAWQLQKQAAVLERQAAVDEVTWQQLMRSALIEVADLPVAHERLADYYQERHQRAEARRDDAVAARAEALLRVHDRGTHAGYLRGDARLTLTTNPPGARLLLHRYEEEDRRLVPRLWRDLGAAPLMEEVLPWGSYLITAELDGHHPTRLPIQLSRGGHWIAIRPGDEQPTPLRLMPQGELDDDDVLVPAGWYLSGGDPGAIESLPRRRLWIDDFVIRRHPVTCEEYASFLTTLVDAGRQDEAKRYAPKVPLASSRDAATEPLWTTDSRGHYVVPLSQCRRPVALIDWYSASAYARWYAELRSGPWRLPSELEREKAARGVDGRRLPWGDYLEPTYARVVGSAHYQHHACDVDDYPTDESPYGMRGCAGNVRDWCLEAWTRQGPVPKDSALLKVNHASVDDDALRSVRGGGWASVTAQGYVASRFAAPPGQGFRGLGVRVCCALSARTCLSATLPV